MYLALPQASSNALPDGLATVELRFGRALAAEPGHADRDAYGAAKVGSDTVKLASSHSTAELGSA